MPGTTVLLSVDDQVHTARNSAARVILSSGDEVVTLKANTVFKVEDENEIEAESNASTDWQSHFEINPNRALVNAQTRVQDSYGDTVVGARVPKEMLDLIQQLERLK